MTAIPETRGVNLLERVPIELLLRVLDFLPPFDRLSLKLSGSHNLTRAVQKHHIAITLAAFVHDIYKTAPRQFHLKDDLNLDNLDLNALGACTGHFSLVHRALEGVKGDTQLVQKRKDIALAFAAAYGRKELVRLLLRIGAEINFIDDRQRLPATHWGNSRCSCFPLTALHWSVLYGNAEIVEMLLDHHSARLQGQWHVYESDPASNSGQYIGEQPWQGSTQEEKEEEDQRLSDELSKSWKAALHVAVFFNKINMVKLLVSKGADINRRFDGPRIPMNRICGYYHSYHDLTPLMITSHHSRSIMDFMEATLDGDRDYSHWPPRRETTLRVLSEYGLWNCTDDTPQDPVLIEKSSKEAVLMLTKTLLDLRADPNVGNEKGDDVLSKEILAKDVSRMSLFIDYGADPGEVRVLSLANTLLSQASENEEYETSMALLEKLSHKPYHPNLVLGHLGLHRSPIKFLSKLLNSRQLPKAVRIADSDVIYFTTEHDATVWDNSITAQEQRQIYASYVLYRAAVQQDVQTIRAMRECFDAQPNFKFKGLVDSQPGYIKRPHDQCHGDTALHQALRPDWISADTIKCLLDVGSNVSAVEEDTGMTALHYAAQRRRANIVSLLCEHETSRVALSWRDKTGKTPLEYAVPFSTFRERSQGLNHDTSSASCRNVDSGDDTKGPALQPTCTEMDMEATRTVLLNHGALDDSGVAADASAEERMGLTALRQKMDRMRQIWDQ